MRYKNWIVGVGVFFSHLCCGSVLAADFSAEYLGSEIKEGLHSCSDSHPIVVKESFRVDREYAKDSICIQLLSDPTRAVVCDKNMYKIDGDKVVYNFCAVRGMARHLPYIFLHIPSGKVSGLVNISEDTPK